MATAVSEVSERPPAIDPDHIYGPGPKPQPPVDKKEKEPESPQEDKRPPAVPSDLVRHFGEGKYQYGPRQNTTGFGLFVQSNKFAFLRPIPSNDDDNSGGGGSSSASTTPTTTAPSPSGTKWSNGKKFLVGLEVVGLLAGIGLMAFGSERLSNANNRSLVTKFGGELVGGGVAASTVSIVGLVLTLKYMN